MLSPPNIRRLALAAVLAIAQISWCGDQSAESVALIQHAVEGSELRTPELAPFKLRVEIQTEDLNSKPIAGTYELTWVSPTRWREEIKVGEYTETRIGGAGKIWQFPSPSSEARRIRSVAQRLSVRQELSLDSADAVRKPKKREVNGKHLLCATVKSPDMVDQEYCFDTASGVLLRSRSGSDWLEYLEYQRVGTRSFPFHLVKRGKAVVRVVDLRTNIHPDPGLFEPAPGITAVPGCESPKTPRALKADDPQFPQSLRGNPTQVIVSGVVAPDGVLKDLRIIQSGGPEADSATLNALSKWKFRPAACDGVPVPSTIEVTMHFGSY
jgi:TonB family protein